MGIVTGWRPGLGLLLGLVAASAAGPASAEEGSTAALSLKATAVNSVAVPGGPVDRVVVAPGDRVTVQAYLRDWSPDDQQLRAYQAEIDVDSYSSGDAGRVEPAQFGGPVAPDQENPFLYIDKTHPRFVHRNLDCISIADSQQAPGYRWMNVLINPSQAPVSPQDGTEYYLGTIVLEASEDAAGAFTIKLLEDPERTSARDTENSVVEPMALEPLVVEVKPGFVRLIIESSVPADGSIDARRLSAHEGRAARGPKSVVLTFSADAGSVTAEAFAIDDGTPRPPRVAEVAADGSVVRLGLEPGLALGRWTTITYKPSKSGVRIGWLPGDVNSDGVADSRDVQALVEVLNGERTLPPYRTDINDDGQVDADDVAQLVAWIAPDFPGKAAPHRMRK